MCLYGVQYKLEVIAMSFVTTHEESLKSTRLAARVSHEQKRLFKYAADLTGRKLTDFIIAVLQNEATKVIQEHEIMHLIGKDRDIFIKSLLNPPSSNSRLKKAAKRYKEIMGG